MGSWELELAGAGMGRAVSQSVGETDQAAGVYGPVRLQW